jgi:hypothetical protein
MRSVFAPVGVLLILSSCGPMTVEQAERACFERARLAAKPRGEIAVGASTGGAVAVYETCVMAKSGEAPRRPLYMRPDWKG